MVSAAVFTAAIDLAFGKTAGVHHPSEI